MSKKKIYGNCRICGIEKKLTQEHYIPRAAGGAMKLKLYKGEELMKTLHNDKDGKNYKPKGIFKQNGLAEYTLCKECNEYSGLYYDKDFALFYNIIHFGVQRNINIPEHTTTEQYLRGKSMKMTLKKLKPFNIAKRILVSFSSVEHAGLTERNSEIRKALLDKYYTPQTDDFGIYLSLHIGNSLHYGTIATLNLNGKIEYYLSMIKCSRKEIIAPAVCLCCFFAAFCAFEGLKAEYSRAKYIIL